MCVFSKAYSSRFVYVCISDILNVAKTKYWWSSAVQAQRNNILNLQTSSLRFLWIKALSDSVLIWRGTRTLVLLWKFWKLCICYDSKIAHAPLRARRIPQSSATDQHFCVLCWPRGLSHYVPTLLSSPPSVHERSIMRTQSLPRQREWCWWRLMWISRHRYCLLLSSQNSSSANLMLVLRLTR